MKNKSLIILITLPILALIIYTAILNTLNLRKVVLIWESEDIYNWKPIRIVDSGVAVNEICNYYGLAVMKYDFKVIPLISVTKICKNRLY